MRNQRGFQLISQSSINIKQQKNVNAIYIVPDAFFPFQYWLFFHVDIAGEAGVRCAWPVQHLQRLRIPITGKMAKLSTPKLQESLFYWFWTALLIYTAVFTLFTHAYLQGVWICANGKHAAGSEKTTFGLQINCKTKRIIWKTEKKNKGKNSYVCVSCLQSSFFVLSFSSAQYYALYIPHWRCNKRLNRWWSALFNRMNWVWADCLTSSWQIHPIMTKGFE
jgi:hypothetical protein